MNFNAIIEQMRHEDTHICACTFSSKENYVVVRYSAQGSLPERFYAMRVSEKIGQGMFGSIYKAFPIGKDGHLIENDSAALAAKYIDLTKLENPKEAVESVKKEVALLSQYYPTENLVLSSNFAILISQYFPGDSLEDVIKNKEHVKVKLSDLNFAQRVNLIAEIVAAYNIIHHHTPYTGRAVFMGDIKAANIKVDFSKQIKILNADGKIIQFEKVTSKDTVNVYPHDFGFATRVDDLNTTKVDPDGTPLHMAPELIEEKGGIKSDIYAFVGDFISILGGTDFGRKKNEKKFNSITDFDVDFFQQPYDYTGIFEGYDIPEYPIDIKPYIIKFLDRMQAVNYDDRPSPAEMNRFFTSLNSFCKTFENAVENEDVDDILNEHATTMAFLATGIWQPHFQDINFTELESNTDPAVLVKAPASITVRHVLDSIHHLMQYPARSFFHTKGSKVKMIVNNMGEALTYSKDTAVNYLYSQYLQELTQDPHSTLTKLLGKALAHNLKIELRSNDIYSRHMQMQLPPKTLLAVLTKYRAMKTKSISYKATFLRDSIRKRDEKLAVVDNAITELFTTNSITTLNFSKEVLRYINKNPIAKAELCSAYVKQLGIELRQLRINTQGHGYRNMQLATLQLITITHRAVVDLSNFSFCKLLQALKLANAIAISPNHHTCPQVKALKVLLNKMDENENLHPFVKQFDIFVTPQMQQSKILAKLKNKIDAWDLNPFMTSNAEKKTHLTQLADMIENANGETLGAVLQRWKNPTDGTPSRMPCIHAHRQRLFAKPNAVPEDKTATEKFLDELEQKYGDVQLKPVVRN